MLQSSRRVRIARIPNSPAEVVEEEGCGVPGGVYARHHHVEGHHHRHRRGGTFLKKSLSMLIKHTYMGDGGVGSRGLTSLEGAIY